VDENKLKHSVCKEFQYFSRVLCDQHASRKGGKNVLIIKRTLWKNYLNFVKDVPMIYINFTIIVITVSEKKIGGITFVSPLVTVCCAWTDLW
jgi:hypothetical protein